MDTPRAFGILIAVLLSITTVFAAPPIIESFEVKFVFPSQIQMDWKISDDDGLARVELYVDSDQVHSEMISGMTQTSLFQVPDDNETHTYKIRAYDIHNESSSSSKQRGGDASAPTITSSTSIFSQNRGLLFTTDEPAYCKVGLSQTNLIEVSKALERNHTITLPFSEGSNKVYVQCSDAESNIMKNLVIITYTLDTKRPGLVSDVSFETEDDSITITWTASEDDGGIASYKIYNSAGFIAESKSNSWTVTTDDSTYFISAVDRAGNEGDKAEYNLKRDTLLGPKVNIKIENQEVEENVTKQDSAVSSTSRIAWMIFAVLAVIFMGWKIYEHKSDRHGLRRYLKERRKMRDFDIKTKI